MPWHRTDTPSSRTRPAAAPAGPALAAAMGALVVFLGAAPLSETVPPQTGERETPPAERHEIPATDFPSLRVRDPRADVAPGKPAGSAQGIPTGIDLETLEARLDWLPLGPGEPTPVLVIQVSTAGTSSGFPEGAAFDVHVDLGEVAEEHADAVLSARLVAPLPRARRRHAPADPGSRPAVIRFTGPGDPGGLSSMVPGVSITFRVPLHELLDAVPRERREAARHEDGSWTIHLWVTAGLEDALDRLPDEGRAPYRFSPAPPETTQKETSASFSS